jgi:hypothetical protein
MKGWPLIALLGAGCFGGTEPGVVGAATCDRPATLSAVTTGCALLYGSVSSTRGDALDGIEGSIRPWTGCSCQPVTLQIDDRGLFSATVYRVTGLAGAGPDTGMVTVVVQATAPKYPRHVTGAPYFDTVAVALRFAATGSAPEPRELKLRIPLP